MPTRVKVYVAVILIAAVAAVRLLYVDAGPAPDGGLTVVLCFALLGTVAQLMGDPLARQATASISFIPLLATALLVPHALAIFSMTLAVGISEMKARKSAIKVAFNLAQLVVSTAASILAYRAVGGRGLFPLGDASEFLSLAPAELARGAVLPITFLLLNSVLVSGVIGLHERKSIISLWKNNHATTVAYDLVSLPFVFLFASIYARWGVLATMLVATPLYGIRHLYRTKRQLERTNSELLELMVAAIEARDPYTSGHSRRVSEYSRIIAKNVGLDTKEVDRISRAGLLHDVGKIHEVFAPILQKPDRLTDAERLVMESHPIKSADLIRNVSHLHDLVDSVMHHHENWDGTGYPKGLAGESIPLGARIIMLADTIDAMTTDRPYRAALTEADVRREIVRWKGTQFDPALCDRMLSSAALADIFAAVPRKEQPAEIRLVRTPLSQVATA